MRARRIWEQQQMKTAVPIAACSTEYGRPAAPRAAPTCPGETLAAERAVSEHSHGETAAFEAIATCPSVIGSADCFLRCLPRCCCCSCKGCPQCRQPCSSRHVCHGGCANHCQGQGYFWEGPCCTDQQGQKKVRNLALRSLMAAALSVGVAASMHLLDGSCFRRLQPATILGEW